MDPEIAFEDFKLAVSERRYVDAAECAQNILEWLEKGGFCPRSITAKNKEWLKAYNWRE